MNDSIADMPLDYTSFDDALALVRALGQGSLFAKIDVKSAFVRIPHSPAPLVLRSDSCCPAQRCIAVHPSDRWLLGMRWNDAYFADLVLPFGMKSSPAIWERYATLAEWIIRKRGVKHVLHYVDDFLIGGSADSNECAQSVALIVTVFGMHCPLSCSAPALAALTLPFQASWAYLLTARNTPLKPLLTL